jgi:glycosyltransferase involved in cell wall biosynthesis
VLEALENNRAIITHATGGIPEILHHKRNGILVPFVDEEYFAQAMIDLVEHAATRRRYEGYNRRDKKKYSIASTSSQTADFYRQLLASTLDTRRMVRDA